MSKDYNPVKVKNTSAKEYGVIIHPMQDFYLVLETNIYGENIEVETNKDYIELKESVKIQGRHILLFEQKQNLIEWSNICRCYLGKVLINSEKGIGIFELCVTLEGENNKNIVTIINPPKDTSIKVPSEQALEVVLYDKNEDEWEYTIVEGDSDLSPKNTYIEIVDPNVPEPPHFKNCLFAGHILKRNPDKLRETHMWFRVANKDSTSSHFTSNLVGSFKGGKITFNKKGSSEVLHELDVTVVFKKKEEVSNTSTNTSTNTNSTTYYSKPEKFEKRNIILKEKKSPSLDTDTRSLYYHEYESMKDIAMQQCMHEW